MVATSQTKQDWQTASQTNSDKQQLWTCKLVFYFKPELHHMLNWHSHRSSFLVTHLSHPEGDFINLVDRHECLHIVEEEHIVEDGRKQGQRAVEQRSGEDTLPAAPDAPAHSSLSSTLLRLFSVPSCNHLTAWPTQGHHLIITWEHKWINSLRWKQF